MERDPKLSKAQAVSKVLATPAGRAWFRLDMERLRGRSSAE
jgi:hypothetical protein